MNALRFRSSASWASSTRRERRRLRHAPVFVLMSKSSSSVSARARSLAVPAQQDNGPPEMALPSFASTKPRRSHMFSSHPSVALRNDMGRVDGTVRKWSLRRQ